VPFCGSELSHPPGAQSLQAIFYRFGAECLNHRTSTQEEFIQEIGFMKNKLFAVILALTVMSWAQTAMPPQNPASPTDKAKPSCCQKMANGSNQACMRHEDGKEMASGCSSKDVASCCGRKDAKACMKGSKCTADCCKEGAGTRRLHPCCDGKAGKDCEKECCASNKSEKLA
jgi:hypothetical protein